MSTTDSYTAAAELAAHFLEDGFGHAANVAELVLERLPNGEHAWLRSEEPAEDDDALYVIADCGRRDLRMADCFGPWPTCAEAILTERRP